MGDAHLSILRSHRRSLGDSSSIYEIWNRTWRKCIWITSGPVESYRANTSLESVLPNIKDCCTAQQLEILDGEQWYKQSGRLKPTHRLLAAWIEKLEDALRSGFAGLRVTGSAAIIEHRDWGKFNEYEITMNNVIPELRMKALCSYSLQNCRFRMYLTHSILTTQRSLKRNLGRG